MKRSVRKGVVLTEICGEYYLAAGKEARQICPYIVQINSSAALIFRSIQDGLNEEEIYKRIIDEYEPEDQMDLHEMIRECLQQFHDMGYIVEGE